MPSWDRPWPMTKQSSGNYSPVFLKGPPDKGQGPYNPFVQGLSQPLNLRLNFAPEFSLGLAETIKFALWYEGFLIHSCMSPIPFLMLFPNIFVPPILSLSVSTSQKNKQKQKKTKKQNRPYNKYLLNLAGNKTYLTIVFKKLELKVINVPYCDILTSTQEVERFDQVYMAVMFLAILIFPNE